MKKQFMRYRLIADQKVGRANKSEVLSEELLQVEKHIEHVRSACQSTYKKLSQCMQSHGSGDYDKRLKRLSENTLAQAMQDACRSLLSENGSNQSLGHVMKVCAEAQSGLAKEKAMYEMFVDEQIISPLQNLVEVEIPSVQKQRDRLKKLVLDRDGANQNHVKAQKVLLTPGINYQQASAKAETLKEEYDQAVTRMEQCKDQLVTDMFEYISKEVGHSQRIADFHAKQLDYHRRCVALLEKLEPDLNEIQEKTVVHSWFGRPLAEHLKITGREIASPIEACVLCLLEYGIKEEGIFRIGGGAAKLRKFKALVDGGALDLEAYDAQDDIHAVAGALKQYLRELPDPLLTHDLYDEWMATASVQEQDEKLQKVWQVIEKLPTDNKANLRYLIKFCALVAESQEVNKMTASNLAVVLAPNLLWSNMDDISKRMMMSNIIATIIELMISYSSWFFPADIDFVATPNATSYTFSNSIFESKPQSGGPPPSPTVPLKKEKSLGHSPTPSLDLNQPSENSTKSSTIQRRKTKRAPPPPQPQGPPPQPQGPPPVKPVERNRSSPVVSSAPLSMAPNENSSQVKPPVAAKRTSSKKQLASPLSPMNTSLVGDAPSGNENLKPKPRPPVRKLTARGAPDHPPPNLPPIKVTKPAHDNSLEEEKDQPSPPMPSSPPPPLPSDVEEDMGASLTAELHPSSRSYVPSDDDGLNDTF